MEGRAEGPEGPRLRPPPGGKKFIWIMASGVRRGFAVRPAPLDADRLRIALAFRSYVILRRSQGTTLYLYFGQKIVHEEL